MDYQTRHCRYLSAGLTFSASTGIREARRLYKVSGVKKVSRGQWGHIPTFIQLCWNVRRDPLFPQAAGVIHTDFEKGFIRAEVIAYDDFIAYKGEQGAKDAGKWRLEGKEYVMHDGDVVHFRFNV